MNKTIEEQHDISPAEHLASKKNYNTQIFQAQYPQKVCKYYTPSLICERANVICRKQLGKL